jgi:hypothetical protein
MTTYFDTVTVDRLIGKCYVMFVRDYFKFRPKVFVFELKKLLNYII